MTDDELEALLSVHDDLVARRKVDVWVGAEPTFTRPDSLDPAWHSAAEGDDKLARAHALACAFADNHPGAAVSRVTGRQYPEEHAPRFAFGVRWRDSHRRHAAARVTGRHPVIVEDEVAHPTLPLHQLAPNLREAANAAPHAPPTDVGHDRWMTVTPDPGVIEINMAPCATACELAVQAREVWRAASAVGLSPTRFRFNGDVADSGGGGQITLGGERPETSPFLLYPHVLPALIRYLNNHPSLSYWFASECVGSASQGPRPDEGARERWDELPLALTWLETLADRGELSPEQLWHALHPLLVDASGNSHRAEANVEKLWNPHVPVHGMRHGRMGVVELRAVRMPERPEMLAALGALLRSLVARLAVSHYRVPLVDWHDELHDRFALPSALTRDLRFVLGDLDDHGLGIPAQLRGELEAWRTPGLVCNLGDATLSLRPALEFWPLVGDVASQERATSRLVDASTERWELSITGPGPDRVIVNGRWCALRNLGDGVRAIGVRRRTYQPSPGFHPNLPPRDPLVIEWAWAGRAQHVELWGWRPDGGPYSGLPTTASDALARRTERIRVTTRDGGIDALSSWTESRPFTVDTRLG